MSNAVASSLGLIVGSIIAIYILHAIWEFALFKRVLDDPLKGKFASVIAAYFTASILSGFFGANGGNFKPSGFLTYLVGAGVVGFFALRRGLRLREALSADEEVAETFN